MPMAYPGVMDGPGRDFRPALSVLNFSYVQPRVVRMRTVTTPLRSLTTIDPA